MAVIEQIFIKLGLLQQLFKIFPILNFVKI